ncbi:hypothetical protein, partial [Aeromonas jandaei]|uniref:hypothetical protein n=1 Tax=Aeromonas jandaei TaxID=650 RepID=UPI0012EC955A
MIQINYMGKPPHFDGTNFDYWKRKMCAFTRGMNKKIWDVIEHDFAVIDIADPTPREEEKLQWNDVAINLFYEAF